MKNKECCGNPCYHTGYVWKIRLLPVAVCCIHNEPIQRWSEWVSPIFWICEMYHRYILNETDFAIEIRGKKHKR